MSSNRSPLSSSLRSRFYVISQVPGRAVGNSCGSTTDSILTFKSAHWKRFTLGRYLLFHSTIRGFIYTMQATRRNRPGRRPTLEVRDVGSIAECFVSAKANSFEELLDPFLKICHLSTNITIGIAKSQFSKRVIDWLGHSKALVRLNLLRIVKTLCDIHPNRAILVKRYGIYEIVAGLSKEDGTLLVRELAREIMPTLAPAIKPSISAGLGSSISSREGTTGGVGTPRYQKKARRTASENVLLNRHVGRSLLQESANTNLEPLGSSGTTGSRTRLLRSRLNDIQWQKAERS